MASNDNGRIINLFLVCLFAVCFNLYGNPSIYWAVTDFPPFYIQNGAYKEKGPADLVQTLLQSNMAEYDHKRVLVNVERMQVMFATEHNVCNTAMLQTPERRDSMYFSRIPIGVVLSSGIVILRKKRHLFPPGDKIALSDVLRTRQFIGGMSSGRHYGMKVDEMLAGNQHESRLLHRSGEDINMGLLGMLARGRVDYILAYDNEINYLLKQQHLPFGRDDFMFIPLSEQPEFQLVYAACSKTPFGAKVIDKIDAVLKNKVHNPEYKEYWTPWFSDKERYGQLFDSVYK